MTNTTKSNKNKKQRPLVSIVIPAYNCEKYIQRALHSVYNQTFTDFECIVVNDGSTDNTETRIKECNLNIHYIYQQNLGASAARNKGIKYAKGDYIAFLDADDYWMPTKLEKQVDVIKQYPDFVLVGTKSLFNDDLDNKTIKLPTEAPPISIKIYSEFSDIFSNLYLLTSSILVKKDRCLDIGGFDESLVTAEDLDFYFKICLGGKHAIINQVLAIKEDVDDSLGSNIRSYSDNLFVIQRIIKTYPDFSLGNKKLIQNKIDNIYECWVKELLFYGNGKEARKLLMDRKINFNKSSFIKLNLKSYLARFLYLLRTFSS